MGTQQNIAEWLEKLQRESWNLELLISGFSIFLLVQAKSSLLELVDYVDLFYYFERGTRNIIMLLLGITVLSCYALIISLTFHVVLRGFWIGAIGLRSVQPKVDFQRLRYAPTFEQYLDEKLPTLDRLLIRLDRISSAIFSFAFLIIFMLISLATWFFVLSLISFGSDALPEEGLAGTVSLIIAGTIQVVFLLSSILYLMDTLSMGLLKKIKQKHISKLYRWIYRLMTTVTLSFFYRSIYYHLVSYFGLWPSRILLSGFVFIMILTPYVRYTHSTYYPDTFPDNEISTQYYDDIRTEKDVIWHASIPSAVIADNSLPLFIRYAPKTNKTIAHLCPDYEPGKRDQFIFGIYIEDNGLNINDPYFEESNPDSLLGCLSMLYEVRLNDSLQADPTYYYITHPNKGELGIYTVLDIEHLPKGHHTLGIDYKIWRETKDTVVVRDWATIPFWKEGQVN